MRTISRHPEHSEGSPGLRLGAPYQEILALLGMTRDQCQVWKSSQTLLQICL